MVDYEVTMELEKVDYRPSKSCPHLKITEGVRLPSREIQNCCLKKKS